MLRSWLIALLIFGSLPLILMKPHVGILVWSWISYMNPHRLTYGFAYSFSFLDFVALCTMVGLAVAREPKSIPNHPVVWVLAIYYLWTTLTLMFAALPDMAMEKWISYSKIILFTFLTMMLMQSKVRVTALIWVIVLAVGFFAVKGGLFTVMTGGAARVWGPPMSFLEDNNQFALAVVMLVPLIRYLHIQTDHKYLRWALMGGILFSFFAIFGTQSRGALVAITAMLLFLTWKSKRFVFGLFSIGFALGIALLFMPESWHERMATIQDYDTDASAQGRLTMWKFAIDVANDNPILGGGFNVFYHEGYRAHYLEEGATGRAVHSIYFEALGEHGYVGLFLFLLLGMTTFFTCSTIIERSKSREDLKWLSDLAAMTQVSIVGYAAAGAFLNLATFDFYYHLIAITAIMRVIVAKTEKDEAEKLKQSIEAARPSVRPLMPGHIK